MLKNTGFNNNLKLSDGQFERRWSLVNRISLVETDNARGYFESLFLSGPSRSGLGNWIFEAGVYVS